MNTYNRANQLGTTDKLFGSFDIDGARSATIKKTYMLLSLSVMTAVFGGYIGATTPAIRGLFSSWVGWILAMVVLSVLPMVAMAMRHKGPLGFIALLADGFVAGLFLGPILYMAQTYFQGPIIASAGIITGIVFAAVTGFIMTTGKRFRAGRGIMVGMFFSILGVVVLNMFLQMTWLSALIAGGLGIFGVFILMHATSEVLHNPEADSPIPGALMLFSGLFNVFVSALHLLMFFADD